MIDQAMRLRELMREHNVHDDKKKKMEAQVLAVASGKGGVGKSNFAINLAIQMRRLGKRVVVVDADFGLANVEILLGVSPKHSVTDVVNGTVDMANALTQGPLGCMFLSGGTGINALRNITDSQIARLTEGFLQLDNLADYIIIDTRAGLSNAVLNFVKAATDTVIITTPDPTAIADAYALMKTIRSGMNDIETLHMVINCCASDTEAKDVYDKLNVVSSRFLGIQLSLLGTVKYDEYLVRAVRKQKPVSTLFPNAESTKRFNEICRRLLEIENAKKENVENFVMKLVGRQGT